MHGKTQPAAKTTIGTHGARRNVLRLLAISASLLVCATGAQAWTLKTLYNFCAQGNCSDGSFPLAGLARDAAGNLYGTTETGGAKDQGVVFEISPNGNNWSYKVLHSFCYACGDGAFPAGSLVLDVNGNLYGTTEAAGPNNLRGTVFRLSPNARGSGWNEKILHTFTGSPDGDLPPAGLTYQGQASGAPYDGVSPLFGNTARGGAQDRGTVFTIAPKGKNWKAAVLYSFCPAGANSCTDGDGPSGGMTMDASGKLYGLTGFGGSRGDGALYQLAPNVRQTKWRESVLYSFCSAANCTDGTIPQGPVAMDSMGRLFGTTTADAAEGGVVFKLAKKNGTWRETVLHTFCTVGNCTDGYLPVAGVMIDAAGNLFGTNMLGGTGEGGIGAGTVFELTGRKLTTIYNFCSLKNCADGSAPAAPLIMDSSGNFYGTTSQGGPDSNAGTVFELSP